MWMFCGNGTLMIWSKCPTRRPQYQVKIKWNNSTSNSFSSCVKMESQNYAGCMWVQTYFRCLDKVLCFSLLPLLPLFARCCSEKRMLNVLLLVMFICLRFFALTHPTSALHNVWRPANKDTLWCTKESQLRIMFDDLWTYKHTFH